MLCLYGCMTVCLLIAGLIRQLWHHYKSMNHISLEKKYRPRCYQISSGVLGWLSYTKCRWLGLIHTIIKFPRYNVLSRTLALSANSVSVIDKPLWSQLQMKVFCRDFNKLFTPTIHISKLFFLNNVARCMFRRDLISSLSCIVQWHFTHTQSH